MCKAKIIVLSLGLFLLSFVGFSFSQEANFYYDNWIDHNKNGKQVTDENSLISVRKRIINLLKRMIVEEKSASFTEKKVHRQLLKCSLAITTMEESFF